MLDPSQCYNETLVKPANVEQPIGAVLRRIQALPIAACQDIGEAFFRLKLDETSAKQLCFLMDYNLDTKQLTAENTARTRLVGVKVKSAIMGVTQSPFILAICKGDLDLADDVLKFLVQFLTSPFPTTGIT